jgi:hypothetical protein
VLFANKSWKEATRIGGILLATDSLSMKDSTFMLRLATATSPTVTPSRRGVAARGLQAFPKDPRLFSTYVQFVRARRWRA